MPGGAVDGRDTTAEHPPRLRRRIRAFGLRAPTVDALQPPPAGRVQGLRPDAVDLFRTEVQEQDEDDGDQEGGQQQDGHHDDLLLVHTDLCKANTAAVTSVCLVTTETADRDLPQIVSPC